MASDRSLLTTTAFVMLLTFSALQTAVADVRDVVMNITQQACDAFRVRDLATVERLLAPEFTLVNSDSSVQQRSDVIAEIQRGDPQYDVFRNHSMTAHVFDDAAIVQGITTLKGSSNGQPFAIDVRFTDTLIKTQGQWRLIVSHVTRIPPQ